MAKLYAEIENSKGKKVSLSDNEILTATVYDGNMKAYSVIIEWGNVGDPIHIKCNHCGWEGDEEEVYTKEMFGDKELCPQCHKGDALMDTNPTMSAIVTTREWRNRLQTNDKADDWIHSVDNT